MPISGSRYGGRRGSIQAPTFDAYSVDPVNPHEANDRGQLRRPIRDAPVPAPSMGFSTPSVHSSTPVENFYESVLSSEGTAATSPPSYRRALQGRCPAEKSPAATVKNRAVQPSQTTSASLHDSRHQHQHSHLSPDRTPPDTGARALSAHSSRVSGAVSGHASSRPKANRSTSTKARMARNGTGSSPSSTPHSGSHRGGHGSAHQRDSKRSGPPLSTSAAAVTDTTSMMTNSGGPMHAVLRSASQNTIDVDAYSRSARSRDKSRHRSLSRSTASKTSHHSTSSGHLHRRQETQLPPAATAPATPTHREANTNAQSAASASPTSAVASPTLSSPAAKKAAARAVRKEHRRSLYAGHVPVHGYVAQTAYAQKNPFRRQDFAEFAANPTYLPPNGFDIYSQAMATRVYGLEVSRASQGEFMMQRLVDAAHPASPEERAEMETLLSTTLERMQVGDWFYKWTRINHVHQRYLWLNLQRGTLMWSLSPKQSVVLNVEIKLSTVTSITTDCLQLGESMRVFYRMTINTPDRCISLATEIRKKFDIWYRVLLQLTTPNLEYGVPGVWGRPSSSMNTTGRGAASRWATRFSPLDAVVDDTSGQLGYNDLYRNGMVSSSD